MAGGASDSRTCVKPASRMNFLAFENRGDTERVKFWNGSHLKTKTGIFQMVEVVSG